MQPEIRVFNVIFTQNPTVGEVFCWVQCPATRLLCNSALSSEPGWNYQVSTAAGGPTAAATLLCSELTPSESDWAPWQGGSRTCWTSQLWPWLRAATRPYCAVSRQQTDISNVQFLSHKVTSESDKYLRNTCPVPAGPVAGDQTIRFSYLFWWPGPLRDFPQPPLNWLELSLLQRKLITSNNWEPSKQTNDCLHEIMVTPLKFVPPQCYISCYISNKTRQLCFSFFDLNFLVVVSSVDLAACWCVLEWCWQCSDTVICISGLYPSVCASMQYIRISKCPSLGLPGHHCLNF